VKQRFGMNPAQGVVGDAELAGVVGDEDRVAHQSLRPNRAPQRALGQGAHQIAVEDVDAQAGRMHQAKLLHGWRRKRSQIDASSPARCMKRSASSLTT
jgi:hypothetical protein